MARNNDWRLTEEERRELHTLVRQAEEIAHANATLLCDPTTFSGKPCITQFYDTRVAYDPYAKRFMVLSAARYSDVINSPY